MKKSLLASSLCATGIILPQIIFASDKNGEVSPDKPNIIFILADDMGYGDLSCYGNQYVKTPNIDRLAETGTRFNQCYAGSGISSPSRCALMTGKNTGNTRIRDNMCTAGGIAGVKIIPNGDSTSFMGGLSLPCTAILLIIIPITAFTATRSSISLKMQTGNMASTTMT